MGEPATVTGAPLLLLRAEGAAAAAIALALCMSGNGSWFWFAVFALAPDLSFAGYLAGPRFGAAIYNAAHTYGGPAALWLAGWWSGWNSAELAALIWAAHIGVDRALGYGLKYATSFSDTHLGHIGRAAAVAKRVAAG